MRYQVKVLREPNEVLALEVEASNEMAARSQAMQHGKTVLGVRPAGVSLRGFSGNKFPVLLFSQQLLTLLKAGLSLVEAIETIAGKEQRLEVRRVIDAVLAKLRQGQSLSSALEDFPADFPAFYVATVRASERTGDMPEALRRYIAYREKADWLRDKIVSAAIYPAVLLVVGGLVVMFLMFFVMPRFSRIYDDVAGEVPFLSRLLLEWGRFFEAHSVWAAGLGVFILGFVTYLLTRHQGRAGVMAAMMRIPLVRERYRIFQLVRLYRTLAMLLRGGIPVLQAMDMASGLLVQELRDQLRLATRKIGEGIQLSRAMEEHGLTTPVALRMLQVGERSGHLGEMMESIASFHEEEMSRWIDRATRLIEPVLMVMIGIVIGGIVILMYMPIFELAGSIQ